MMPLDITLSSRLGWNHNEPTAYARDITLQQGSGLFNGRYVAKGVCHNCQKWESNHTTPETFSSKTTDQPMIYAFGQDAQLASNAQDAGLRRHSYYGQFSIDTNKAIGDFDNFPPTLTASANAQASGGASHDGGAYADAIHALLMAASFVLLLPLGAAFLRLFHSVRLHWLTQTITFVVLVIGSALGLYISTSYNRVSYLLTFKKSPQSTTFCR